MSCLLPHFEILEPLDGARAWTAHLDSYDQRLDTAYYRVTLYTDDQPSSTLMAAVSIVGDDWTTPAFTNTPYAG